MGERERAAWDQVTELRYRLECLMAQGLELMTVNKRYPVDLAFGPVCYIECTRTSLESSSDFHRKRMNTYTPIAVLGIQSSKNGQNSLAIGLLSL